MASTEWDWERYRGHLRLRAELFRLRGKIRARFDASDLTQETLHQAVRHQEQFRGESEGEQLAWLEQVQDRLFIDFLRQAHAARRDVDREIEAALPGNSALLLDRSVDLLASPSETASRREIREHVSRAILDLPEEQRETLLRVLMLQQTLSEAAEQMERTRGSVAGHYARGLATLRTRLGPLDPGS